MGIEGIEGSAASLRAAWSFPPAWPRLGVRPPRLGILATLGAAGRPIVAAEGTVSAAETWLGPGLGLGLGPGLGLGLLGLG